MKAFGIVIAVIAVLLIAAWLALRGPDIPYETLEAKYADAHSHFVDLPGGLHVHYQEYGDAGAPLLVLLHGFGDSFTSWDGWVAELGGKFPIIRLDFPGHGLTRAPADYALGGARLADFVDAFAAALSLPKFAVAGNSLGGGVAWQLALRHPDRIDALILVDAGGFPNEKPPAKIPLAFRILKYRLGRAFLRNIDNRPLIDEGLKTDVYDKSVITPAFVDRWAEFQRAQVRRGDSRREADPLSACGAFAADRDSATLGRGRGGIPSGSAAPWDDGGIALLYNEEGITILNPLVTSVL